jgi:hypothetical protein
MYNVGLHGARRPGMMGGMPATFWDRFWDSEYRQRTDIEDIRDIGSAVAYDLGRIGGEVQILRRQVDDLTVLCSVLVKMLEETNHVDSKTLRYRVEAELDRMHPERSILAAAIPASNASPAPEPPPTTPTKCSKCGTMVPANRTNITAEGVVCDNCLR